MKVIRQGVYFMENRLVKQSQAFMTSDKKAEAVRRTVTYAVLRAHGAEGEVPELFFDAYASRGESNADLLRTADALGLKTLRKGHVLFEAGADVQFVRAAWRKFGGVLVPASAASEDAYLAERVARAGDCMLASWKCRLGALGTVVFEGDAGDFLRQMTGAPARFARLEPFAVYLKGKPKPNVGPVDVALALSRALAAGNYSDGKILEFFGPGLANLTVPFRLGVEAALRGDFLSTVWETDQRTEEYFRTHGREGFRALAPVQPAYYEGGIVLNLSDVEPMISLAGEILPLAELLASPEAAEKFGLRVSDGKIAADACRIEADYETAAAVSAVLRGKHVCRPLSLRLSSRPALRALAESGYLAALLDAGVDLGEDGTQGVVIGTSGGVVLDARSVAATAACGCLAAADCEPVRLKKYVYSDACYQSCVREGEGGDPLEYPDSMRPLSETVSLAENLALTVCVAAEGGERPVLPEAFALPAGYTVNGPTMPAVCVFYSKRAEGAPWGEAVRLREGGAAAVIAKSFSEKLRTHLIDWGILPLVSSERFSDGDVIVIEDVRDAVKRGEERVVAKVFRAKKERSAVLVLGKFSEREREILLAGSLIAHLR